MRRREFITLFGAAAWPRVVRAQQAEKVISVGILGFEDLPPIDTFRQTLNDLGYVAGKNVRFEHRYAKGRNERFPELASELVGLKADVILTWGIEATLAAKQATAAARGGERAARCRNASRIARSHAVAQFARAAQGGLHRVALLSNPDNPTQTRQVEPMREAAQVLKLDLTSLSGRPAELESSLAALTPANVDGFIVSDDPFLETSLPRLIALAAERRLPALYGWSFAVKQGGLISYSADFFEIWRQAAGYVDRVLKGAQPADLPVEQATRVALKINLKTARALGLEISPMMLTRADEVIE
jgi:putative ABC transport system substrate-binding protein